MAPHTVVSQPIFLAAEATLALVIREAAARAFGDPWRALDIVREWADAVPGRRTLLIRATRSRVECLPVIDELVGGVFELVGGDEDATNVIVDEFLRSPLLRERLDRQIAELAARALLTWTRSECRAWLEQHGR